MKNYRVNTAISEKHYAILKKHTKEYGTQRSVLEHALEKSLKNYHTLSKEEEIWMQMYQIKDFFMVYAKDYSKMLFDTSHMDEVQKYLKKEVPVKFFVEWMYNKPFEDFKLLELIDGILLHIEMFGFSENVSFKDSGDYYTINILHELGINGSKIILYMNEDIFKDFGAKFQSEYSLKNVFFKIYK